MITKSLERLAGKCFTFLVQQQTKLCVYGQSLILSAYGGHIGNGDGAVSLQTLLNPIFFHLI